MPEMTDSDGEETVTQPGRPLSEVDFEEMRAWMYSRFREYMTGRQILRTLSDRTIRRYRGSKPSEPRMTNEEKDLSHALIAALYTYQQDAVACAQSGADLASALMASAACEGLAIFWLLQRKKEVKETAKFKKLWRDRRKPKRSTEANRKQVTNSKITFGRFLIELRLDDLYALARAAGLYDERSLPARVSEVLSSRGYPGQLTEFVKRGRNCIHTKNTLAANDRYARVLDVFYSPEGMKSYHADFALCAWELHGRLSQDREMKGQNG